MAEGNAPVTTEGAAALEGTKEVVETKEQGKEQPTAEPWKAIKHKVKLADKEMEIPYDELVSGYQMAKASQSKFQEAAEIRNQALELIQLLKTNPKAALSHEAIGVDVIKLAQDILSEKLEDEVLTPEQKEFRELKKFREQKLAEEAEAKKQQEQAEYEKLQKQYEQQWEAQFKTALDKSGLPKTRQTIAKMAYYMAQAIERGYNHVSPEDVVPLVREDYLTDIKELFGASNDEILLQMLGDDLTNKVVKSHMNKVKKPGQPPKDDKKPAPKKEDKHYVTEDEWKKRLDERVGRVLK